MIVVRIDAPFGSFRKSYARSFAETYPLPPPATIYGMLLSLVGERIRRTHDGVKLAFAFKRLPRVSTTLRKLSRFKYGVASKQSSLGNAPDYVETLCGIEAMCWVDSSEERQLDNGTLERRICTALESPEKVERFGLLCLGMSDDAVDYVSLCQNVDGDWLRLLPDDRGELELPVWVDHVGGAGTRWQRYHIDPGPVSVNLGPAGDWKWTVISSHT